jgi:hypothetical protein
MRARKPKPTFAQRMAAAEAKYGTYDPATEGRGTRREWKQLFEQVMGIDEAAAIIGGDSPLAIMGFVKMPTAGELKKRYRELMLQHHPDKGGDEATAKRIIAAYTTLKEKLE